MTIELNETLVNLIIFVVVAWAAVRIVEAYLTKLGKGGEEGN